MKSQTRLVRFVCLLIVVLSVFTSCTGRRERTFAIDAAATLKDRTHMALTIQILFDKKEGVAEAAKKKTKIRYGVSLVFRDYTTREINNMSKNSRDKLVETLVRSIFDTPISAVKISNFSLDEEAEKPKSSSS